MDLLTQGLLGGVLAQSVSRRQEKTLASLVGFASGLLADADVLIRSSNDPLLNIEYHRHFTHSLLFIPLGALIAGLILWPLLRSRLPLPRVYVFALAGYSLSGLLDACTSYGTHLFWPFSDERVSLNIISIVDPVFTLVLLLSLIAGIRFKTKPFGCIGLFFCALYLAFGFVQMNRATQAAGQMMTARGHMSERHVVKPTLGNLLLWRSIYEHEQRIYVDAVRVGIFVDNMVYPGDSVPTFVLARDLPALDKTSVLYGDIQRFKHFSDHYIAYDPTQANVIGDVRYSMLPTGVKPLWGIEIQPGKPQQHADYLFFRDSSQHSRQAFINMLLGEPSVTATGLR